MSANLLTDHRLELFLSLKGDYTGSSESTHVKMPHCWKSHVTAQFCNCSASPVIKKLTYLNMLDPSIFIHLYWKNPVFIFEGPGFFNRHYFNRKCSIF